MPVLPACPVRSLNLGHLEEVGAQHALRIPLVSGAGAHLADLSAFIGKPISLSAEPTMNPEQYDIVLI